MTTSSTIEVPTEVARDVYVTASTAKPDIWCPDWCEQTAEQHLADLAGMEGRVVHQQWRAAKDTDVSVGRTLLVDGAAESDDAPVIIVGGREFTIAEARELLCVVADVVLVAERELERAS